MGGHEVFHRRFHCTLLFPGGNGTTKPFSGHGQPIGYAGGRNAAGRKGIEQGHMRAPVSLSGTESASVEKDDTGDTRFLRMGNAQVQLKGITINNRMGP